MRVILFVIVSAVFCGCVARKRPEDKTKCPKVKSIRNFDLEKVNCNIHYFKIENNTLNLLLNLTY